MQNRPRPQLLSSPCHATLERLNVYFTIALFLTCSGQSTSPIANPHMLRLGLQIRSHKKNSLCKHMEILLINEFMSTVIKINLSVSCPLAAKALCNTGYTNNMLGLFV
mmetsp:Transcript_1563/g.2398  ORF Transcript_1563/g.2398 Transcript_1563/m.2398 type:complete len:108 (+) Transcript_1563:2878-3201(+)